MLTLAEPQILSILRDYGIHSERLSFTELQRYDYEYEDPALKHVRLIIRVDLPDRRSLVLRFKKEEDAPHDVIEAQSRFAALLRQHGIETPETYASDGRYARLYVLNGYDVVVTVERFESGEIQSVDPETARQTGQLLAEMHCISEKADAHVHSEVLFDPLAENDLFSFSEFVRHEQKLLALDGKLYQAIVRQHAHLASILEPFGCEPRYAVQGDISDCNLYRTRDGRIGVFDFNRCGDNQLYFDAVMQAIFEARLMDYPPELAGKQEEVILSAFLNGYWKIRPFTSSQEAALPYFYALVNAFWGADLRWGDDSLRACVDKGDDDSVLNWMREIYRRETEIRQIL